MLPPEDAARPIITEILTTGDRLVLRTRMLRLDVVGGPCAGQTIEVAGPEVRVGSGKGMDLLLVDSTVSRHHVTLRLERSGVRVLDAQSRNGTVLDGVRVVEAFARRQSVVEIGNSTLRVDLSAGSIDLPLSSRERFGALLGKSMPMRRLFTLLERVAPTDETVLVEGETGTGKELAAEAIHEASPRAGAPFVVFDCSAVAANLVESELFGHVRGAFTGAHNDREGAFEAADGGTLFLDEIGELPLELQPKLLRALEKLEVRRVGANTVRRVDVRVVAATNRNLAQACQQGRFREDLLYRLAVVRVVLPPLRERPEDLDMLANHFADLYGRRFGQGLSLDPAMLRTLRARAYPGNVRELRNAVTRALTLGDPDASAYGSLAQGESRNAPLGIDLGVPFMNARERLLEEFERSYLTVLLTEAGGSTTKAAELSGLNPRFIQRAIVKYGLREG